MAWEVDEREFESVLALAAPRRYEYLVKRIASHGQLWGLRDSDGWVIAADEADAAHFPVWPHQRFAQALVAGPWATASPESIQIDEWVEEWLPDLDRDRIRVSVFQTPADEGVSVAPLRMQRDLIAELEQFHV